MAHLLQIDASPRGNRSISRTLGQEFIDKWMAVYPNDTVTYRDLGHHPVPHVTETWIAAAFSPSIEHTPELADAIRISDELVDELIAADRYLIATPIFNFMVPSTLKAYIDQIVRIGRTVVMDGNNFQGLLQDKKVLVIASQGGNYQCGTPDAALNHLEPYLRTVFGFMGITDMSFIYAHSLQKHPEAREEGLASARESIQGAIDHW
ncbi:FMN-dependent NADH-azoreductase [Microcoleus sp. B4-D4]|uniref:FMN-dependent NADH-azoreductase n=1 Tax=Microcoleus sp. B4-D4 TaxID=2818667 RepID=UPI002FD6A91E